MVSRTEDRYELRHAGYGPGGTSAYTIIDRKTGEWVEVGEHGRFLFTYAEALKIIREQLS